MCRSWCCLPGVQSGSLSLPGHSFLAGTPCIPETRAKSRGCRRRPGVTAPKEGEDGERARSRERRRENRRRERRGKGDRRRETQMRRQGKRRKENSETPFPHPLMVLLGSQKAKLL